MMNLGGYISRLAYRGKTEHLINCHLQDIPSNGADTLHFKFVHTYIFPQMKSLYMRWQPTWKRGDDPTLKEMFDHPRKDFREYKQQLYKDLIESYPNKEVLSVGNLENWIGLPFLGEKYMFTSTIIQVGLAIVFVILKSPFYELAFHLYIRPEAVDEQIVFHDLYMSSHMPYFVSSMYSLI